MNIQQLDDALKAGVDAVSIGVLFGTLFDKLPQIAALFTLVWTCFRIYETRTVQGWLKRWRERRAADAAEPPTPTPPPADAA